MSNLHILLKNDFNRMLGSFQGKKARKKVSIVTTFLVLAYIGICAIFCLQVHGLFQVMSEMGLKEIPVFNSMQIFVMLILIISFQSISDKTRTNDSDLLLSLPIKKVDIALSKTISKYLFNLVLDSMIMIPTLILYCIYMGFSLPVILWGLLLGLLMPLMGVGINYILNFLVIRLFNRMKHSSLIKTIFALVLFAGFISIYIYNSSVMGLQDFTTIDNFLNTNFFIGWCVRLMVQNNLLCLLYLSLVIFGVFGLGILLYALTFGKTYLKYKDVNAKVKFEKSGLFDGLLKKEINNYFSTPIFMFNTIIGPILFVMLTVFVCIKGKLGIYNLFGVPMDTEIVFTIITLLYLFLASMTLISCCTISMEGRFLWILKSTPVNTKKVLFSKSILNLIIFMPIEIITAVINLLVLDGGLTEWIMLLTLPNLLNVILSFGGTYINILLPKLNWEIETQVVKQSLSLIVTMFLGLILCVVPLVLGLCNISTTLSGYISLGIYLLLAILSIVLLFTDGVKKFNKLEY